MAVYVEAPISLSPGAPPSTALSRQDEQLAIARTLAGDVEAFNELVLNHQQLAFSVAYRILQSRDAAADVVQESFIKAFCALPSFNGGSFKSWLMRIVINNCYDLLRRNRHHSQDIGDDEHDDEDGSALTLQPVAPGESPHDFVERMELRAQIEVGLRNLSPEQRLVLVLFDIHGRSYAEISEITGFVIGTIKSRISRARARLRNMLTSQPDLLPVDLVHDLVQREAVEMMDLATRKAPRVNRCASPYPRR